MNGTLGTKQPGAYNSGTLGAIPVTQPGAYRSGSLGRYAQPGSYNSGSLGFTEPQPVNSGILGVLPYYAAQAGLGAPLVPQNGAYNTGVLGEYFSSGVNGLGCSSCSRGMQGLGATTRYLGYSSRRSMRGLGAALGDVSLGLDMMVGIAMGIAAVYFAEQYAPGIVSG